MAESVVVADQQPQRFFCHLCNVEIDSVLTQEFTCPICDGGFIEELPPTNDNQDSEDVEMSSEPYLELSNRLSDQISMLMSSFSGPDRAMEEDGDLPHQLDSATGGEVNNGPHYNIRHQRRPNDFLNFDNIMHEFLLQLTSGNTAGGGPMLFMGNPGDYAWGHEGLDTVITQMLNQMENSGPPPLDKDKIDEIPKVEVDEEQINQKLQCSVCWEDFQLRETVRKLPCLHIYHENCIIPWLNLHGTCPVCRLVIDKKSTEEQAQNPTIDLSNMSGSLGSQVIRALHNLRPDTSDRLGSRSTGGAHPSSTSSHRQTRSATRQQAESTPSSSSTQPIRQQTPEDLSSRRDKDGNVEYDFD